jgi:nucleotide-binding universal stress UspA family protein
VADSDPAPAILVTSDGSVAAQRVIPHAARLAAHCGARLVLVRTLSPLIDLAGTPGATVPAAVETRSAEWGSALEGVARALGVDASAEVVVQQHGEDVTAAILRAASAHEAALIAMHSRGQGALRRALLGSVTMGVLGKTVLPVMVTGAEAAAPRSSEGYHLVITTDGSPAGNAVFVHLAGLLPTLRGRLTLLRVCDVSDPRTDPEAAMEDCERDLAVLRDTVDDAARVEAVCIPSSEPRVAGAIVGHAIATGADAIALATHGHSALRHLVAGSTALDILATSPLPLILVRSN